MKKQILTQSDATTSSSVLATVLTNVLAAGALLLALLPGAANAAPHDSARQWQLQRLFHPTPAQLTRERQGSVFIYDGLSARDIDRALKQAFDRVDAMMFVNVIREKQDQGDSGDDGGTIATSDDDDC